MTLYRDDYTKCEVCWAHVKQVEQRLVPSVTQTAQAYGLPFEDVMSAYIRDYHRCEHVSPPSSLGV